MESSASLTKSLSLERIVSLVGEAELSNEDALTYNRARKIKNYMTQNFFMAETQKGVPGAYVALADTIKDVDDIVNGKYDKIPEDKLLFIGNLASMNDK